MEALVEHDFLSLVRTRDHDGLASAWDDAVQNPGDVEIYCQTLTALCERTAHGTALDLGTRMVDALQGAGRAEDAIRLGITLIRKEAHNEAFARGIVDLVRQTFGGESWYPVVAGVAGLDGDPPAAEAFAMFERARRFLPGHVVYHRAGWDEGLVEEIDAEAGTIHVRFAKGIERDFPLDKAVQSLRPLDDDDIRAMRMRDAEGLGKIAEEEPARLIRMAAKIFRGSITSTQVKAELSPSVIPQKKWAAWWKRAKTAASSDPWLEVTGSKTRPVFEVRRQPLSLKSEAEKRFGHCMTVPEAIELSREYLARGIDDSGRSEILDLAKQYVDKAIKEDADSPAHLLDGILFLEEQGRPSEVSAAQELRRMLTGVTDLAELADAPSAAAPSAAAPSAAAPPGETRPDSTQPDSTLAGESGSAPTGDPSIAADREPALDIPSDDATTVASTGSGVLAPEKFDNLATQESRDHAVRRLPEALGERWADWCIADVTRFPASVVEQVVDLLVESGEGERLLDAWPQVAPFPHKHPVMTYLIGKLYADRVFDGRDDRPDQVSVARVLLHLARMLTKEPKSNVQINRLRTRLVSLLVGRRAVLVNALEGISREDLANFLGICERGGSDFPSEVTTMILRTVANTYPDITSKPERPFWENKDVIYVSQAGFRRHKEEHRVLVDEKIPVNAQAINQAASYGDLSENSEWEAAMEEQRNLTGRAEEMSNDLRRAKLLEDQHIPEDIVAPGTRVVIRYPDTGDSESFRVMGPWDCIEPDIINYRAPLAQALLGHRVGDEVASPDGERPILVESVERIIGD